MFSIKLFRNIHIKKINSRYLSTFVFCPNCINKIYCKSNNLCMDTNNDDDYIPINSLLNKCNNNHKNIFNNESLNCYDNIFFDCYDD